MTEEIDEDVKVIIDVLPPSSKDKAYETLKLSNKRESLLEETTPTKAEVEVKIEIDSKPAKEHENKMTNKGIIVEMEEPCLNSCPQKPLPHFKSSLATGFPPKPPLYLLMQRKRFRGPNLECVWQNYF